MKTSDSDAPSTEKKKRASPGRPSLPSGVLLRVDVRHDGRGHIDSDTRERLTPGWSDERNAVAKVLLETVTDLLEGFPEESEESGREDPKNPRSPNSQTNPDLLRLYG